MNTFASVRPRALLAIACALTASACGAKTGLRVWDSSVDAGIDATPDVPDVVDVTDVSDARDAIEPEEAAAVCIPGRFDLERRGAEIMLVIDRSSSMAFSLDGAQDPASMGLPSRWQVLRDALGAVVPMFDRTVSFGAKFYPQVINPIDQGNIDALCNGASGIDLEPALGNAMPLLSFFARTRPGGGTPTHDGLLVASNYLRARPGRGTARYIVLATDGGPNCNAMNPTPIATCVCTSSDVNTCRNDPRFGRYNCLDADRTVALVRDVAQPSMPGVTPIPVYVIGMDGSMTTRPDLLSVIDDMAVAGGRPRPVVNPGDRRYYSVRNPGDLQGAFQSIVAPLARCAFVTPSRPDNPDEIDVEINGRVIRRDATRAEGWDWTDANFGEITFFGMACAEASLPATQVRARVGCRDL
jgi:hypothetical protein